MFTFYGVVPLLGGIVGGSREAYAYLPNSLTHHPDAPALRDRFARAGFSEAGYLPLMGGAIAIHYGRAREGRRRLDVREDDPKISTPSSSASFARRFSTDNPIITEAIKRMLRRRRKALATAHYAARGRGLRRQSGRAPVPRRVYGAHSRRNADSRRRR